MPKSSDLYDFLLAKLPALDRRDLAGRFKSLRSAGLLSLARRVGGSEASDVTERDCANVLMALVGSNAAYRVAEAVKRLRDLPLTGKASVEAAAFVVLPMNEPPQTFGEFLDGAIAKWRHGERPWRGNVEELGKIDIGSIRVSHGAHSDVIVEFPLEEQKTGDRGGYLLRFADAASDEPDYGPTEGRAIHGHTIGIFAIFLSPPEKASA